MCKLVLNVGDIVRNIYRNSPRRGLVGKVVDIVTINNNSWYMVEYGNYGNKEMQSYNIKFAHKYIEKLVSECPCQQQAFKVAITGGLTEQQLERLKQGLPGFVVAGDAPAKRRVLKKVRRNVITGKTQDDFVREMGHAKGVAGFNTRALGRSTGQALYVLGSAMMYPGNEICISGIDHACSPHTRKVNDQNFRELVQTLIGNMKGFTFTDTHIVFNPIVTEETYVEL